jgi:1-deoxy-D-xylulose-5-phosphate synthase
MSQDSLLNRITSPADLRTLKPLQLPALAQELRDYLIATVSGCGGHFGAGLGVVELTVALHYVFDTPHDPLVWDVGHQSYPHKVLTGRRERLSCIRQRGGLAPFNKREESEYDAFGVGHSSTSISAALGMAVAAARRGENRPAIAVIGDGALTAGMAFEALNHAGDLKPRPNLLIVLNDNEMSISPNVGALSSYLTRILSGRLYSTMRKGSQRVLEHMPPVWEFARRAEEHMKGMLAPGTLFEELGVQYFGPVDGHDLPALIKTLNNLKALEGPRLLHVVTKKGKGYAHAEANPVQYHGVTPFDPAQGMGGGKSGAPTYTEVFGKWLCDMAAADASLAGITPAMREGSGLVAFSEQFPDRYFDVGIAEQHAVTFAAGLATQGLHPVVAIYSTFLQRAYDQLIHDVALQNLPVLFAIDRAGLVGPDGPTHAGSFDLSYLRCVPNMLIMAASDENECRLMLNTGYRHQGPAAVRYPRGKGPGVKPDAAISATLPLGRGEIRRRGTGTAILSFGSLLPQALEAAASVNATVANMRFIKPLDEALILELASSHDRLICLEENAVAGGAGAGVAEVLAAHGLTVPITLIGLPDRYIEHASREEQLAECGLDAASLARSLLAFSVKSRLAAAS